MKLNRRVTIITRFSGIMFSLLLLGGLAACSDDNNGSDTPEPEPSTTHHSFSNSNSKK